MWLLWCFIAEEVRESSRSYTWKQSVLVNFSSRTQGPLQEPFFSSNYVESLFWCSRVSKLLKDRIYKTFEDEVYLEETLLKFLLENALKKTYKWPYWVKPKVYLAWYPILSRTMNRFLGLEQDAVHGTSSEYSPRLNILQSQRTSWFIWGSLYLLTLRYLEYMGLRSSLHCVYDIKESFSFHCILWQQVTPV